MFGSTIARAVGLTLFSVAVAARAGMAQTCPQVDLRLSIAAVGGIATQGSLGLPDQASINLGTCITLRLVVIRQSGSVITTEDVTTNPNTHFLTNPPRGIFSGPNGSVWCPTTAECNLEFPIYGTFFDTCTGTTFTDTVHVHVNPCPGGVVGPTINCAGLGMTFSSEIGQCGAHVSLGTPVVGGGVPPLTVVCTAPIGPGGSSVIVSSGTFFPVGSTMVTCTVTDHIGQTASCAFVVTVLPPAPTITCPGNITTGCNGVATFAAIAHSSCPGTLTITYWIGSPTLAGGTVISSPHTFPVGMTTVYAQATDTSVDRSNICSFIVTVPACAAQQGCTPGYWKNHPNAWRCYSTTQTVGSVFSGVDASLAGETLLQALQGGGGPGLVGAETILLRAAVAALLNACRLGTNYPLTQAQITSMVNAKLATGDRNQILNLATVLDNYNNLGCPLN